MKTLKQRLRDDELVRVFALARAVHPMMVEMFALAGGYHGFWLDQEHAAHSSEQIASIGLAARANAMDFFVRIPPTGYWHVTQCLEAGAGGVMVAQIHSVDEAREAASWARFTPEGTRGLNASGRDADYTHRPIAEFVASAGGEQLFGIQIETAGAVEDADEIAALDNVDLLFVGPSDLSLALGVVGQFHHEKLWEAIGRVAAACRRHGKWWGAVVPDAQFAARALEHGCRMPTVGNETLAMRRGIAALRDSFADVFAGS